MASECDYLKEELGPVLAKGIASTVIARPSNPPEYLALWLLHYLQRKEQTVKETAAKQDAEVQRAAQQRDRQAREKVATVTIQREWQRYARLVREEQQAEVDLRQQFAALEETIDDEVPEEVPEEAGDRPDAERNAEVELCSSKTKFRRSAHFVALLSKSNLAFVRRMQTPNAVTILRCCLYAQGYRPSQVLTVPQIQALIKPYSFLLWMSSFNPMQTGADPPSQGANHAANAVRGRRAMERVRRLLSVVDIHAVKDESAALYAIATWLMAGVMMRHWSDDLNMARRTAGRDAEEVEDVPPDDDDADRDAQEEEIIQAEQEALRETQEEVEQSPE